MASEFEKPDFEKKDLELRFENGVVCIYGTAYGLGKLAKWCAQLIERPNEGHIHMEHYGLLTDKSLRGVIAIFAKDEA
ncbi:MAG TPA: hypothetical protein PLU87_09195 [Sedimentisphaerales bacterium]|nr:hypothetical protein [Sedimentisphaerales bacterium]HRS11160.1 hypothetical protein [Sedimentisphaerales bacterium]HRV47631.1 hypothetical protein [Sedimentisphaerales bacterium]